MRLDRRPELPAAGPAVLGLGRPGPEAFADVRAARADRLRLVPRRLALLVRIAAAAPGAGSGRVVRIAVALPGRDREAVRSGRGFRRSSLPFQRGPLRRREMDGQLLDERVG